MRNGVKAMVIFLLGMSLVGHAAGGNDRICPAQPPLAPEEDDLRTDEADFTLAQALESLRYLRYDVPELIYGNPGEDWTLNGKGEGFRIGYPNSVKVLEGLLLKQQALLARAALADARRAEPASSPEALEKATHEAAAAEQSFCDFAQQGEFVD